MSARQRKEQFKMRVRLWIPVFFWLAAIAYFSNQPFSRQDLAPVLERYPRLVQAIAVLLELQFRYAGTVFNNRRDPVRFLQFCLRKAAHVFLYGMYGLSLVRALGASGLVGARGFGLAALLVVLVAMLDEHNQARIAGRSGRPEDVALDFAGFLLFCGLAAVRARSHGARLGSAADDALRGRDL